MWKKIQRFTLFSQDPTALTNQWEMEYCAKDMIPEVLICDSCFPLKPLCISEHTSLLTHIAALGLQV